MSIFIVPNSRVVGHSGSTPDDLYYPIEVNWKSPWRAMNSDDAKNILDEKGRSEMEEIVEYWKGKTLSDLRKKAFKGDLEKYFKYEGTFLSQILHLGMKKSEYYYFRTKKELRKILRIFRDSEYRYLHLSCHGDENSFATTLESIEIDEFSRIVKPFLDQILLLQGFQLNIE